MSSALLVIALVISSVYLALQTDVDLAVVKCLVASVRSTASIIVVSSTYLNVAIVKSKASKEPSRAVRKESSLLAVESRVSPILLLLFRWKNAFGPRNVSAPGQAEVIAIREAADYLINQNENQIHKIL